MPSISQTNVLQQKTSDTFAAFRKAAQEKQDRARQLKEQQEVVRAKKEAAERERQRMENERRKEREEEEMLEMARKSMSEISAAANQQQQQQQQRGAQTNSPAVQVHICTCYMDSAMHPLNKMLFHRRVPGTPAPVLGVEAAAATSRPPRPTRPASSARDSGSASRRGGGVRPTRTRST